MDVCEIFLAIGHRDGSATSIEIHDASRNKLTPELPRLECVRVSLDCLQIQGGNGCQQVHQIVR